MRRVVGLTETEYFVNLNGAVYLIVRSLSPEWTEVSAYDHKGELVHRFTWVRGKMQ